MGQIGIAELIIVVPVVGLIIWVLWRIGLKLLK